MKISRYWLDLTERVVRSFVGGAIAAATVALADNGASITSAKALAIACLCGGISAVLGLLSRNIGPKDSAGTV